MVNEVYGKKIGMTQIFSEDGTAIPVTAVVVEPLTIVAKKTVAKEGYNAIVVSFGEIKEKKLNKPVKGHFAKANVTPKKHLREFRVDSVEEVKVGDELKADVFAAGDKIDIQGTSKGKGYQGVIKRWNYHLGPAAHGSGYHRGTGSMGSIQPARIKPGKKLPGRMGGVTKTVQNLEFVKYDAENNVILIKGNVPGAKNSYVVVTNAVKAKKPELNPEALA